MKKLLFTACLGVLGIAAKAQTAAVQFYRSSLLTTTTNMFFAGNNVSGPSCAISTGVTAFYPVMTSPTVVTGTSTTPPMTNMTLAWVDVEIGGIHYAKMMSLCGLVPGTGFVLSFPPSSFTCHYDVLMVTPSVIRLYFYP